MLLTMSICVVALAGFVQGLTSFGFALIAVPLLARLLPLQLVVPIVVILSLGSNFAILRECWTLVDLRTIRSLIFASLVAAPLGTGLLLYADADGLRLLAGLLVSSFAAVLLFGRSFPIHNTRMALLAVGAMSGMLNGSVAMSGPPVALFLSNQGASRDSFRANLTSYAIALNILTVITYSISGLLTAELAAQLVCLIPAMLIGVLVGQLAVTRVNDKLFRRISLGLICAGGLWAVMGTLANLHT